MKTDWKELLQFARATGAEQVPAGFKTRAELQKQFCLGQSHTSRVIKKLLAAGKIECKKFRVPLPSGTVRAIPHYKIK